MRTNRKIVAGSLAKPKVEISEQQYAAFESLLGREIKPEARIELEQLIQELTIDAILEKRARPSTEVSDRLLRLRRALDIAIKLLSEEDDIGIELRVLLEGPSPQGSDPGRPLSRTEQLFADANHTLLILHHLRERTLLAMRLAAPPQPLEVATVSATQLKDNAWHAFLANLLKWAGKYEVRVSASKGSDKSKTPDGGSPFVRFVVLITKLPCLRHLVAAKTPTAIAHEVNRLRRAGRAN